MHAGVSPKTASHLPASTETKYLLHLNPNPILVMKSFKYALLAAAACGMASAAETAYTTPVGYTTQTLPANTLSLVGFNVLPSPVVVGTLTDVTGGSTVLTDTASNFTTILTAGTMYTIEINDGPGTIDGTVQEFTTWSGNTITVPAMPGVAIGDKYKIRPVKTLQELFPAGFLTGAALASSADKVWVPNGSGGYNKYWYRITISPTGWRTTTTGLNDTGAVSGSVPLPYIDGILIEKKGTATDFVQSGEIKTTPSSTVAIVGLNPISVVPPAGLTLFTSGLDTQISGAALASGADKIWVPNGSGGYTKYWYRITISPTGWRTTTTGLNDTGAVASDVPLTSGIMIERKNSAKTILMNVPSSYSGL